MIWHGRYLQRQPPIEPEKFFNWHDLMLFVTQVIYPAWNYFDSLIDTDFVHQRHLGSARKFDYFT